MNQENDAIVDPIGARARLEFLEQDLSLALHLLYAFLRWILEVCPAEFQIEIRKMLHFKLLQLPQGCRIGRRLIELDDQLGGFLETRGIWLKRWVYEPREK